MDEPRPITLAPLQSVGNFACEDAIKRRLQLRDCLVPIALRGRLGNVFVLFPAHLHTHHIAGCDCQIIPGPIATQESIERQSTIARPPRRIEAAQTTQRPLRPPTSKTNHLRKRPHSSGAIWTTTRRRGGRRVPAPRMPSAARPSLLPPRDPAPWFHGACRTSSPRASPTSASRTAARAATMIAGEDDGDGRGCR